MIDIKQTETKYLLCIPHFQKRRARAIDGRRWDPERTCWGYPRTNRMYEALIAEFGDELFSISITRPSAWLEQKSQPAAQRQAAQNLQAKNQGLKDDLAKIHESLKIIKKANGNTRTTEL